MTITLRNVAPLATPTGERVDLTLESTTASGAGPTGDIDASELFVSPGFIDLQVNGGYGIDLAREPERLGELASQLPQHGITAWLPTLVSSSPEIRGRFLDAVRDTMGHDGDGAAKVLGAHLEGPAISFDKRGAHRPEHLISMERFLADERFGDGFEPVRMVTLAPELPGAAEAIERLVRAGVVVAVGHTDGSIADARMAADFGASYATHLFNAMSGFHHRDPGVPGAVLTDGRYTAGLIVDGIHLDPATVELAWRMLGPTRTSLVSDATAALGNTISAPSSLGDAKVAVTDAVRTVDGVLAGTNLSLDQAVRNLVDTVGCSLADAVQTVTTVPRRLLGVRGTHQSGDATLLTPEGSVVATIIDGHVAWDDGRPLTR